MTQIIEKLAEVLAPDAFCIGGEKSKKDWAIQKARTILQHLRDNPTPEMMAEGVNAYALHRYHDFTTEDAATAAVWSAILNTALGEE